MDDLPSSFRHALAEDILTVSQAYHSSLSLWCRQLQLQENPGVPGWRPTHRS